MVECGCVATPISTRDAASFQLPSGTTFKYNSCLPPQESKDPPQIPRAGYADSRSLLPEGGAIGLQSGGTKTPVLNFIGTFPNPWKGQQEQERLQITNGKWSPSVDDLEAVVGSQPKLFIVKCLEEFLGAILSVQNNTIARINVFSHGMPGLMGLEGTIDSSSGDVTFKGNSDGCIASVRPKDIWNIEKNKIVKELRQKFTSDAEMVLYLCNSGMDKDLGKALSKTFQVTCKGFRNPIFYCADLSQKPPVRGWTKYISGLGVSQKQKPLKKCSDDKDFKRGFAHLSPDIRFT